MNNIKSKIFLGFFLIVLLLSFISAIEVDVGSNVYMNEKDNGSSLDGDYKVSGNGDDTNVRGNMVVEGGMMARFNESYDDMDRDGLMEKVRANMSMMMSNGHNISVKIMPETASSIAIERLRLKVCSEENNCTIELKEVGSGDKTRVAYEVRAEKDSRMLFMFKKRMEVRAEIDAETGDFSIHKPWWAFLAAESNAFVESK